MSFTKYVIAAFVVAGCVAGSATAYAAEPANLSACVKLQKQVKDALSTHQQASNYDQAKKEERNGLEFCSNGLYKNGVSHYTQALKLMKSDA